jgi:hypothetical protein
MAARRYLVKMVTLGSPGWSGRLWGAGCTHLSSAERLFDRRLRDAEADGRFGAGDMLLLIDKESRKLLRAVGTQEIENTARSYGLSVRAVPALRLVGTSP